MVSPGHYEAGTRQTIYKGGRPRLRSVLRALRRPGKPNGVVSDARQDLPGASAPGPSTWRRGTSGNNGKADDASLLAFVAAVMAWASFTGLPVAGLIIIGVGQPARLIASAAVGVWAGTRYRRPARVPRAAQSVLAVGLVGLAFAPVRDGLWASGVGGVLFVLATAWHVASWVTRPIAWWSGSTPS